MWLRDADGAEVCNNDARTPVSKRGGLVIPGGDAVSQPTDTMIDPATIEARCRRLMAEHAATKDRGWDSERTRADLHAEIDAWLDAFNEAER